MTNAVSPHDVSTFLANAFADAQGLADQRRSEVLARLSLATSVIERRTGRAPNWARLKSEGLDQELSSLIHDPWLAAEVTASARDFSQFVAAHAA